MLDVIENTIPVITQEFVGENVRDWLFNNFNRREVFAIGGHPSEKGHEIIAKRLIDYINSAKLLEC